MCFSPQRRAIFRHLNRQKCSEPVMFWAFWLSNVLFATAARNFWFLLGAPTSAPAALTGLLFDWPDTRIIEKTQHFATSLTFGADVSSFFWLSRYCIFCRLTWWLYCWAMHLLFNCPYCRKFLFKLPSTIFLLGVFVAPGFNCAIAACEKSKDWHQALKLLEATFGTSGPRWSRWYDIHLPIFRKIGWWNFQGFLEFSPLTLGRWSNFVLYFSDGLKQPTSNVSSRNIAYGTPASGRLCLCLEVSGKGVGLCRGIV